LGVLFDEKLSFRPHYESIANKSHKLLGFIIRSTKDFKQASSTITLFYSLVRSVLEYCSPVWSPYYSVHINDIERAQKRCLRFLTRKFNYGRSLSNYGERLSKFGVIPLHARRDRYDLLCLHKILHSSIRSPELLSALNINIKYRSRCPHTFALQVYKNNTSYYNPLTRMCRTYNQYTHDGKDMDIFDARFSSFKRKVSDFIKAKWS
jgi:hypothetical protein